MDETDLSLDVLAERAGIPSAGLHHVLTAWIGRGELLQTVATAQPDDAGRDWTPGDTRTRAAYVTFLQLRPCLSRLPRRVGDWVDLLPAHSTAEKTHAKRPAAGTMWAETVRHHRWPPSAFVVRTKQRGADDLLITTLVWVLERCVAIADEASRVDPSGVAAYADRLAAARAVLASPLLAGTPGDPPTPVTLLAIEREGASWRIVAALARILRALEDPLELARALLVPDDELRPVFFQLGVLGEVLIALREQGATPVSTGPLGLSAGREHICASLDDRIVHVWFEGGGAWTRYGENAPHRTLTAALAARTRALSPDVLLIEPGGSALVLECKYSTDPDYIGRAGVAQASLYALELFGTIARTVDAYVVAKGGAIAHRAEIKVATGRLGVARPDDVAMIVAEFTERLRR